MTLSGYMFEGPYDPDRGFTKDFAVVYAILDHDNFVIDVGETSNINERFPNHERKPCWERNINGEILLYILKEGDVDNRRKIEKKIREEYKPLCGKI